VINASQTAVNTTAVVLITVPPGVTSITIANGAQPLAVGVNNGVTLTNGGLVPANGSITIPGYATSSATTLWGISNSTGTTASLFLTTAR
jgi:hypothetical protein